MALVRCNNCNKETNNEKENCLWCNKKLDKNLNPIESKLSKVKKKPEIKKHWVCEECQEENELSFDRCWKCQRIDKKDKVKKNEELQILKKKEAEVNELAMQIIDKLKKKTGTGCIISILGFFIWFFIGWGLYSFLFYLYTDTTVPPGHNPGFIGALIIFSPYLLYLLLHKRLIKIPYRKKKINKAIKELGLENHKHINEIINIVNNSSVGIK